MQVEKQSMLTPSMMTPLYLYSNVLLCGVFFFSSILLQMIMGYYKNCKILSLPSIVSPHMHPESLPHSVLHFIRFYNAFEESGRKQRRLIKGDNSNETWQLKHPWLACTRTLSHIRAQVQYRSFIQIFLLLLENVVKIIPDHVLTRVHAHTEARCVCTHMFGRRRLALSQSAICHLWSSTLIHFGFHLPPLVFLSPLHRYHRDTASTSHFLNYAF